MQRNICALNLTPDVLSPGYTHHIRALNLPPDVLSPGYTHHIRELNLPPDVRLRVIPTTSVP